MYLRVAKCVYVHVGLFLLLTLSLFTPSSRMFLMTFLFAVLHECFHLLAALTLRVPVKRILLLPYGLHLRLGRADFLSEAKIAATGPIGSFLLFLLFRGHMVGQINLMLCLFNLLPALPLDGGRLLRLFLWRTRGIWYGNRVMRRMGYICGACLLVFAVVFASALCAFVGLMLLSYTCFVPMDTPLFLKKAARTTNIKLFYVCSTDSLLHLTRLCSPFYYALFLVSDSGAVLTEQEVTKGLGLFDAHVADLL